MEQSGELLDAVVQSLPVGVLCVDRAGAIVLANPALEALFGYAPGALVGRPVTEVLPGIVHGGHVQNYAAALRASLGTGRREVAGRDHAGRTVAVDCQVRVSDAPGEPVAVLCVARSTAQPVAEHEAMLARERAARAGAERLIEWMAQLQLVTAAFAQALTPEQVARVMVEHGVVLQEASAGVIALVDADRATLRIIYSYGFPPDLVETWRELPLDSATPMTEAIRSGAPRWYETVAGWLADYPHFAATRQRTGTGALLALPLIFEGRALGAWGLSFREERHFDAEERRFIMALSQLCAQALDRALLHAAEQRARAAAEAGQRKLAALARASHMFSEHALDLPALLDTVAQLVAETIGDSCIIRLPAHDEQPASLYAAYHPDPAVRAVLRAAIDGAWCEDGTFISRVMRAGRPVFLPHVTPATLDEAARAHLQAYIEQFGLHSMIAVPLRIGDAIIGALAVSREQTPAPYTDDDLRFVQDLADRAALAMRNAHLYASLCESSRRTHEALDLLDTFFRDASMGFAVLDTNLRYQRVNERLAAMNGISVADHLNRTIYETVPLIAPDLETMLREVLATGEPRLSVEISGSTAALNHGPSCWLLNCYAIRAADGAVRGIGVVVNDITNQKRAQARQTLQFNVTRILSEAATPQEAAPKLLEAICVGDGWELGAFWRVEDGADALQLDSYWHAPSVALQAAAPPRREMIMQLGHGVAARAWAHNQPIWCDPQAWDAEGPPHVQPRFCAAFAFPIHTDEIRLGAMVFFSRAPRPCEEALLQIGADLGSQIGQFFMRRQAEQQLWQHMRRLKAMHGIAQAILALQPPREIARAALRHLHDLMVCSISTVAVFDIANNTAELWHMSADALDAMPGEHRYSIHAFAHLDALARGEAFAVHDLRAVPDPSPMQQELIHRGMRSYMGVPIRLQEELIGAIYMSAAWPHAFAADATTVVHEVADLLAIALQNTHLFEQVRTGRERLQALSDRLVQAQEEERRRLARELHDEVGQALTAVHLNVQLLAGLHDPQERAARLEESTALVESVLNQVRAMSLELRPSILDDLGLVPAVRWLLARQAERVGFAVQFEADHAEERYERTVETTCFRVVQEALNNIARYARARHVRVALAQQSGALALIVQDDGVGFDVAAARRAVTQGHSLGLLNMQERIEFAGGKFTIDSVPGCGTTIQAWLPLNAAPFVPVIERRRSVR